jgi:uncharacterized protein (DUF1697 family)
MEHGRYIALLRGINVGGNNLLPMKDLAALFEAAGCSAVTTYIQSGNVAFTAGAATAPNLASVITDAIQQSFAYKVPVILRSAIELRTAIENNPFLRAGRPEETLHLSFLADLPTPERLAELSPDRSRGDSFQVVGREIYLDLPNGVARSRLTNAYFDSKLKTVSTQRNWRTVLWLSKMLGD